MRETFDEYKATIEQVLMNYHYLYNGDIIDSYKFSYTELRNTNSTSPSFIIKSIEDIYNISIINMINKPYEEISIAINLINNDAGSCGDLNLILYNTYNIKMPLYYFFSEKSILSETSPFHKSLSSNKGNKIFPNHFECMRKQYIAGTGGGVNEIHQYLYSPLIEDNTDGEYVIYATDSSIQSLVYSIQNMTYNTEYKNDKWLHTINCDLYDCKYKVYKIVIKDISIIRDDKINKLLSEN